VTGSAHTALTPTGLQNLENQILLQISFQGEKDFSGADTPVTGWE